MKQVSTLLAFVYRKNQCCEAVDIEALAPRG
jgi:hypothetical protein